MKNLLQRPFILNRKIKYVKCQIEEYERLASSIPGQRFDREIVSQTRNLEAPFVKWVYKKIDAEKYLKQLEVELDLAFDKVLKVIENLESEDQRLIFTKKYISFQSWREIAEDIYLSVATVRRIHYKALEMINKK